MQVDPTINTYNLYDDIYDQETIDFWNDFPKQTIETYIKQLKGTQVLNLGSGPGRDAVLLRNKGLKVTCLDASAKMVERTKQLGFESIQADFRKMNLKANSFDGAWAYTSLLHISKTDVAPVLKKLHKILKPNGVLLIGMIEGTFEGNKERETMPNTYRYFRFYTSEELKSLVENAKFKLLYEDRYKPHNNTYLSQIYIRNEHTQAHPNL